MCIPLMWDGRVRQDDARPEMLVTEHVVLVAGPGRASPCVPPRPRRSVSTPQSGHPEAKGCRSSGGLRKAEGVDSPMKMQCSFLDPKEVQGGKKSVSFPTRVSKSRVSGVALAVPKRLVHYWSDSGSVTNSPGVVAEGLWLG